MQDITTRNKMMAYVLKKEGLLIPTTNGTGERIYALRADAQQLLEVKA